MARSLLDMLGYMPLTESLRTVASGVPNPFPKEFFEVNPKNRIIGDRARYLRITGERRTSKFAKYGSPALRRPLRDIADDRVRMLHTHEEMQIDPLVLQQMRSFESYTQDMGMEWLAYQIDEAAQRHVNTRVISTASTLRYGKIFADDNGNLLPTSSGATVTVDFGVPASHKDQVSGNISGSWANSSHDVLQDLVNLQQFATQQTGLTYDTALYGANVASYIQRNDFALSYLSRNPYLNEKIINSAGQIPDGFGGIRRWIPVYSSFYESDDIGTVSEIWDDNLLVLMPAIDQPNKMTWWAMYEGSYLVPRTLDIQPNAKAANSTFETVFGLFSYAIPTTNPPGYTIISGDVFLPALKNEKAIIMATVAF